MKDTYNCKKCGDEWTFCPEDYEVELDDKWYLTKVCPLCEMPITQMIRDVWEYHSIKEVLRFLWIRLTK